MTLTDQYRDSSKLSARMNLHRKYGAGGGQWNLAEAMRLAPGARVLEVGCGPGRFWAGAAERLPAELELVLTDLMPGMVEEAVRTVRGAGRWPSVRGEVADVTALPFEDASFDAVVAMHMLYHAPDPDRAVAEIARVLKPAGQAFVTTNGEANMAALFELGHTALGGKREDFSSLAFSLEGGEAILRRHFAAVALHRSADVLRVTDPPDVVAYLTSFPPGDTADDAMLRRLQQHVDAAFAKGGGVFEIRRDTGYMVGRKAG